MKNYQSLAHDDSRDITFLTNPLVSALYLQINAALSAALQSEAETRESLPNAIEEIEGSQIEKDIHHARALYADRPFSGLATMMILQGISATAFKMATSDTGVDDAIKKFDTFEEKLFMNVMEMFGIKCDYADFQKFLLELSRIAGVQMQVPDVATMRKIVENNNLNIPNQLLSLFSVDHDMIVASSRDFVMKHFQAIVEGMTGAKVVMGPYDPENPPTLDEAEDRFEKGGLRVVKPGGGNRVN